jgi:acyl dehydratase
MSARMKYWEDLVVGEVVETGSYTFTADDIKEFAGKYDPQPFHVDEEAAKTSIYGGLIASGWHTTAVCMRLLVGGWVKDVASMGSPGADEIRWLRPVRPGDTVKLRVEVIEKTPSKSKPDRGSMRARYELRNQNDEVVCTMIGIGIVHKRPL